MAWGAWGSLSCPASIWWRIRRLSWSHGSWWCIFTISTRCSPMSASLVHRAPPHCRWCLHIGSLYVLLNYLQSYIQLVHYGNHQEHIVPMPHQPVKGTLRLVVRLHAAATPSNRRSAEEKDPLDLTPLLHELADAPSLVISWSVLRWKTHNDRRAKLEHDITNQCGIGTGTHKKVTFNSFGAPLTSRWDHCSPWVQTRACSLIQNLV